MSLKSESNSIDGPAQLVTLKQRRKFIRQKITRKCNIVGQTLDSLILDELQEYLSELEELSLGITNLDDNIGVILSNTLEDIELNNELDEVDIYFNKI